MVEHSDDAESTDTDGLSSRDSENFPLSGAQATLVFHTELTASTQDDLADLWRGNDAAPYTILIADDQTMGRGRVGRSWYSATGRSLLVSVLLALPSTLRDQMGWLTLIGGAAARAAVDVTTERNEALISWPNDIVVRTPEPRKIAGIIGEFIGERDGRIFAILGMGLNLSLTADELPTPTSASLLSAGLPVPSRDEVVAAWISGLRARIEAFVAAAGDPDAAGLLEEINSHCETLRPGVSVGRPRNTPIHGTGQAILADGSLQVLTDSGVVIVTAGEVSLLDTDPHS